MKGLLRELDKWYRRRIRMVIWKCWKQKRIKTQFRNLIKLGLPKYKAWEYANTRKGYCRIAGSPILKRVISNKHLKQSGYLFLLDYFRKSEHKLRNRRIPNGTFGGVRGRKIKKEENYFILILLN